METPSPSLEQASPRRDSLEDGEQSRPPPGPTVVMKPRARGGLRRSHSFNPPASGLPDLPALQVWFPGFQSWAWPCCGAGGGGWFGAAPKHDGRPSWAGRRGLIEEVLRSPQGSARTAGCCCVWLSCATAPSWSGRQDTGCVCWPSCARACHAGTSLPGSLVGVQQNLAVAWMPWLAYCSYNPWHQICGGRGIQAGRA